MRDKALGGGGGVTVGVVARVLGVSVRTVQRLVSEGMPGRTRTGEYDLALAARWYFRREAERRVASGDVESVIDRLRHQVNSGAIRAGDTGRATR